MAADGFACHLSIYPKSQPGTETVSGKQGTCKQLCPHQIRECMLLFLPATGGFAAQPTSVRVDRNGTLFVFDRGKFVPVTAAESACGGTCN